MSIHISYFGRFNNNLNTFEDLNGFIPELGDQVEDFTYEVPNDFSIPCLWEEFVSDAVEATKEAETGIQEWRDNE